MKQKLLILFLFVAVASVLVGLNFASYSQRPKEADTEFAPNRSTFNSSATGLQAYFSLLTETGIKAVRWQEPLDRLADDTRTKPTHLVIAGTLRREFTPKDADDVLEWVASGGSLIVIDRAPSQTVLAAAADWDLDATDATVRDIFSIDPADEKAMTAGVAAAKLIQPSTITAGVNAVQPSIFAANISIRRKGAKEKVTAFDEPTVESDSLDATHKDAPVAHVIAGAKNLVVDVPHGAGRIVFVGDPFIVSNGGISLADNAQLAINLVRSEGGTVAFDEYHQGHGSNNNRFFEFFAGTPVVAIFLQLLVVVGLLFYSQSRRFARPIGEPEPDRLSKLEYVSAMAALQQRVRAYDLAVENIYRDFKRRASRLLGLDLSTVTPGQLAAALAERTTPTRAEIERTLDDCEQIIYGEPVSKSRVVELIAGIRKIENELGLRRRTERR